MFWWRAASNLHLQASRVNLRSRQFARIRCCVEAPKNIAWNFWSSAFIETQRSALRSVVVAALMVVKKLSIGVTCELYHWLRSARFNPGFAVKFNLKVLRLSLSLFVKSSESVHVGFFIPRATSI